MGASFEEVPCVTRPESIEDLDTNGYLAANTDVRRTGMTAEDHFLQIGQQERRIQFINLDKVTALREDKLARLSFRRPPRSRSFGEPANFLSTEVVAEFDIPENPPVSSNDYGAHLIEEIRANPTRVYLDIGAGLRSSVYSNVINTEIYPSISTDVLCVGEDLPFTDDQFDAAVCLAVLEHCRRPWDVAREICRVVKPGGKILIDYPFLQGVHGYPHHYYNATPLGAIKLFEDYCDIEYSTIASNNHPIHALWWLLSAWRYGLNVKDRERFTQLTVGEILARPPEAQLSDPFCRDLADATQRIIPAGSSLLAVKRAVAVPASSESQRHSTAHVADLERSVAHLQESVRVIRSSTSWRITAPLRALGRLLRSARS